MKHSKPGGIFASKTQQKNENQTKYFIQHKLYFMTIRGKYCILSTFIVIY